MTWDVSVVPTEQLQVAWPIVAPMLAPAVALSNGRWSMGSLYAAIGAGDHTLWLVVDSQLTPHASFTTRIAKYPLKSMLAWGFVGGEAMPEWFDAVSEMIDRYVVDAGLAGQEHGGRLGWDRSLRAAGWRRTGMMHEKDA